MGNSDLIMWINTSGVETDPSVLHAGINSSTKFDNSKEWSKSVSEYFASKIISEEDIACLVVSIDAGAAYIIFYPTLSNLENPHLWWNAANKALANDIILKQCKCVRCMKPGIVTSFMPLKLMNTDNIVSLSGPGIATGYRTKIGLALIPICKDCNNLFSEFLRTQYALYKHHKIGLFMWAIITIVPIIILLILFGAIDNGKYFIPLTLFSIVPIILNFRWQFNRLLRKDEIEIKERMLHEKEIWKPSFLYAHPIISRWARFVNVKKGTYLTSVMLPTEDCLKPVDPQFNAMLTRELA